METNNTHTNGQNTENSEEVSFYDWLLAKVKSEGEVAENSTFEQQEK